MLRTPTEQMHDSAPVISRVVHPLAAVLAPRLPGCPLSPLCPAQLQSPAMHVGLLSIQGYRSNFVVHAVISGVWSRARHAMSHADWEHKIRALCRICAWYQIPDCILQHSRQMHQQAALLGKPGALDTAARLLPSLHAAVHTWKRSEKYTDRFQCRRKPATAGAPLKAASCCHVWMCACSRRQPANELRRRHCIRDTPPPPRKRVMLLQLVLLSQAQHAAPSHI